MLIQRLSETQEQRTRKLLEHEELGDRKPSQFLRHLQSLAGSTVPDRLLRTLWLGRLPAQMQVILATRTEDRLEEVAEQADRIHEVNYRAVVAANQRRVDQKCIADSSRKSLEVQIEELCKQVAMLTTKFSKEKRRREFSRGRSRSRNRSQKEDEGLCYYHRRFKEKARKCEKPCNFKTENNEGSR